MSILSFCLKANNFGFKPIMIDPLSHPLLCSQLLKFISVPTISSQMSLYSIDCVRKIFHLYQCKQSDIYNLLDRARLAEANDDPSFWEKPYEVKKMNEELISSSCHSLGFIHPDNK